LNSKAAVQETLLPVRRSLVLWALLAVLLVLLSYVFSILLAVVCVYLPYLLLARIANFQVLLMLVCGTIVAAIILWSLIPRRDRFIAPGPALKLEQHPLLLAEIRHIATAFREPMPDAIYLTPQVNAWVARRGGVMGFRSRRIMAVGLPLMAILDVSQFRAVLAHEFGHYYSGDTSLGPWVYTARDAMVRTLQNLGSDSQIGEWLSRFALGRLIYLGAFVALQFYWKLYMRATQLISRRQEYRADELAGALAGSRSLATGLRRIEGGFVALTFYWSSEIIPVLEARCKVPIADGFARFVVVPEIAARIDEYVEEQLRTGSTSPSDSHPPLRDRIAALNAAAELKPEASDRPALSLLENIDELELELLSSLNPEIQASELKPIAWEQVGAEVYVRSWRALVTEYADLIAKTRFSEIPEMVTDPSPLVARMRDPKGRLLTRDDRANRARSLLWMALALRLLKDGWKLRAEPGRFCLELGGEQLSPPVIINEIQSGAMTSERWRERARELGIAEIMLASDSAPPLVASS
jgi:Zn-dependent protease with chaperone function